jgi:hypothetical protein
MATAKAMADSETLTQARPRSREFPADPDELRQLPASAMIVSYAAPGGRRLVLADANPGIGGLSAATRLTLEEFRARPVADPADPADPVNPVNPAGSGDLPDGGVPPPDTPASPPVRPAPNLGPPPRRLDWRRGRP